ncbi:PGAP1-like protein [Aureococcus anophagefferens]|uniref:PGAP1-like protein n=1 Tax=Aureococcus anophagefferens TaxID=44056 RepID=A0ABR1GDR8_AURAN
MSSSPIVEVGDADPLAGTHAAAAEASSRKPSRFTLKKRPAPEALHRQTLRALLAASPATFDATFTERRLGFAVVLAKYASSGRAFVRVTSTTPGVCEPSVKPTDELAAVDGEPVLSPDGASLAALIGGILSGPRPLTFTFAGGARRVAAYDAQERKRSSEGADDARARCAAEADAAEATAGDHGPRRAWADRARNAARAAATLSLLRAGDAGALVDACKRGARDAKAARRAAEQIDNLGGPLLVAAVEAGAPALGVPRGRGGRRAAALLARAAARIPAADRGDVPPGSKATLCGVGDLGGVAAVAESYSPESDRYELRAGDGAVYAVRRNKFALEDAGGADAARARLALGVWRPRIAA